jgi:hypothetical protein
MKPSRHEQHIPHESEKTLPSDQSGVRRESGAKHPGIADEDKRARTGKVDEPVRNTPPAGSWNDVASDE